MGGWCRGWGRVVVGGGGEEREWGGRGESTLDLARSAWARGRRANWRDQSQGHSPRCFRNGRHPHPSMTAPRKPQRFGRTSIPAGGVPQILSADCIPVAKSAKSRRQTCLQIPADVLTLGGLWCCLLFHCRALPHMLRHFLCSCRADHPTTSGKR